MIGLPLYVGISSSVTVLAVRIGVPELVEGSGEETVLSLILSSHGFPPIPPKGAFGGPPTLLTLAFGHGLPFRSTYGSCLFLDD
jgi:hypothetical protein